MSTIESPSVLSLSVISHLNESVFENTFTSESPSRSNFSTYKNLLVICVAFLLQFTAFNAIANLQSSLNTEANVGVNSLSIIYFCLLVSAIFLPHPMIAMLGLKWTLVLSQIPYLLYMIANYYPKNYLMYPTALLVGLAAAPLWTSKCSYLTEISSSYATDNNINKTIIMNRFFGLFFMFFQSGQIWGNLISYLVLKPEESQAKNTTINDSSKIIRSNYDKCGADFSEQEYQGAEVINRIDRRTIDILCIIYVCLCIISIFLVMIGLDQRRTKSREQVSVMIRNSLKLLISTVQHLRQFDQVILIPLTIWSGFEQSFIWTQFTKGFISCALSAKYIGLIFIAYGLCDSIGSFGFGQLIKLVGRIPCFVVAAIINYGLIVVMFIWRPSAEQFVVFFVIASLWGLADAVWQTQINAFYGVLFVDNHEAAFSNYRLWESAGFAIFYVITPYLRIRNILIILIVSLTVGFIGYAFAEYRWRTTTQNKRSSINKSHVTSF